MENNMVKTKQEKKPVTSKLKKFKLKELEEPNLYKDISHTRKSARLFSITKPSP